jgi:hypothetical protein
MKAWKLDGAGTVIAMTRRITMKITPNANAVSFSQFEPVFVIVRALVVECAKMISFASGGNPEISSRRIAAACLPDLGEQIVELASRYRER